jgi:glycosyltransferase involved in cell wall biosynthesis
MPGSRDLTQSPPFDFPPRRLAAAPLSFFFLLVFAHVLSLAYASRPDFRPCCSHPDLSTSTLVSASVNVTILIYVRNEADSIARTLNSLQPFRNALVLCCDDASIDDSVSVIWRYQLTNNRLHLRRNMRHLGLHVTRLRSLGWVDTPWLLFLNPGDRLYEAAVDSAVETGEARELSMVQFGCRNEAGDPCPGIPRWNRTGPGQLFRFIMHGSLARDICGRVIRTSMYREAMELIPDDLRALRTCEWGEMLQLGYFLLTNRNRTSYVNQLGEIRGPRRTWKRRSNTAVYDDCQ